MSVYLHHQYFALQSQRVIVGDEMIAACASVKDQLIQHSIQLNVMISEVK